MERGGESGEREGEREEVKERRRERDGQTSDKYLCMFLHKVEIFERWALLSELVLPRPPLVGGAFQIVLLVVANAGREEVVHHHYADVHTARLQKEHRMQVT